jgi:hypothetical protein
MGVLVRIMFGPWGGDHAEPDSDDPRWTAVTCGHDSMSVDNFE